MPNWAGSCWYFLYFGRRLDSESQHFLGTELASRSSSSTGTGPSSLSPAQTSSSSENIDSPQMEKGYPSFENWKLEIENSGDQWLPVDWYIGGAEHAVLHLLYARFWVKAMYDLGLVNITEPFKRLRNVGMVLAEDHRKMSKSLGNVVNPNSVIKEFGADALRVYEMFMAPFNQEVAWSTSSLQGSYRFLKRIWQIYTDSAIITDDSNDEDKGLAAELQTVISKVSSDITNVKFNTAISSMMEFLNWWEEKSEIGNQKSEIRRLHSGNAKSFLKLLAPFAPFMTDELWRNRFGETDSIHIAPWPEPKQGLIEEKVVTIPIQINGKVRGTVTVSQSNIAQNLILEKA
jgi:leucyl-tRNA synthetase